MLVEVNTYTEVADDTAGEALIAGALGKPLSSDHAELLCRAGAIERDHPIAQPSPPASQKSEPTATVPGKIRVCLTYRP